jgi:hypothetical protein
MRAATVVVLEVLAEDAGQVTLANDDQPVQALAAKGSKNSFADGVGARRAEGGEDHVDAAGEQSIVEIDRELGVTVMDEGAGLNTDLI